MTIAIQLNPEAEARLLAHARAQGVPLDAFVQTVIEQAIGVQTRLDLSSDEFDAALNDLAQGSEKLPILPPEAYRRESIYGGE